MFKKGNQNEVFSDVETIIGESIKVKGDFNGNGNIVIDGILEGSLKTKSNIFVGEKAKISGSLEASEIIINGDINGNLLVKTYLSVGSTATITGDIECAQISVEKGAKINGKIKMLNNLTNVSKKLETTNDSEEKSE
ncbi:MAG: polymer-forming cytoskeletal protein [Candidatus Falkowbacteria bacterium]